MSNTIGENKLSKLVRLMQKFERDMEIVEGHCTISFDSTGQGIIQMPVADTMAEYMEVVFRFSKVEEAVMFLEANKMNQMFMSRSSKRD